MQGAGELEKAPPAAAAGAPGAPPRPIPPKGALGKLPSWTDAQNLPQVDARGLCLTNSRIWRCNVDNIWGGRLEEWPHGVYRSWKKYGPGFACLIVVSELWRQWCLLAGVDEENCPMLGLVGPDDIPVEVESSAEEDD